MKDKQGREYAKFSSLKAGDVVELDDGFTCRQAGKAELREDEKGLYFDCCEGHHYVDGQADNGEDLIGVYHLLEPLTMKVDP